MSTNTTTLEHFDAQSLVRDFVPNIPNALDDWMTPELLDSSTKEYKRYCRGLAGTILKRDNPLEKRQIANYKLGVLLDLPVVEQAQRSLTAESEPRECFDTLLELAKQTNVETIFMLAGHHDKATRQLVHSENRNPEEVDALCEANKKLYGPLLEINGYDAFAARLLSDTYKLDLLNNPQINGWRAIDVARAQIDHLGGRKKIVKAMKATARDLGLDGRFSHVVERETGHNMYFSDSPDDRLDTDAGELRVRTLMRIKTIGSIAKKMSREKALPADICGMTVIAEDTDNCVAAGVQMVGNLLAAESLQLKNAPSRREQIHIKGSEDFIAASTSAIRSAHPEVTILPEVCSNGFEAIKITFERRTSGDEGSAQFPFEIQVTHESARVASRIGQGSHVLFKLAKLFNFNIDSLDRSYILDTLQEIHSRRDSFDADSLELSEESQRRVCDFTQDIVNRRQTLGASAAGKAVDLA